MVHMSEMRIVLPLTVDEFRRAQRFANFKTNELNTSEGQGGQLLSNLPYEHEVWGEGMYTHSLYRLGDRLPDWVTKLVPSNVLVIDEKTWMSYPYIRTTISIPFFNKLKIEMISMHVDDDGSTENIHNLSEAELAIRKVDYVDIASDEVPKRDYRQELDPKLYKSRKTGRGPLLKDWRATAKPKMCAYKLVKVTANYWGVQSRAEKLMLNGIRQIVLLTHRNAFCWLDEWYDLTLEEIVGWETAGRQKLKATIKQPPIFDPKTGKELVVTGAGNGGGDGDEQSLDRNDDRETDSSDETSDIEAEYFEAEMELGNQDAAHFGNGHSPGENMDMVVQPADVPERCAVCAARGNGHQSPTVFCMTCKEFFCQLCFSEFHVTARLKAHATQPLLNSSASLNSIYPAPLQKSHRNEPGLPPINRVKSQGDFGQFTHSPDNGQELKAVFSKQDDRVVRDAGSPFFEAGRISRTSSKLPRLKSGIGALNASQNLEGLLQYPSEPASLPVEIVIPEGDDKDLSNHPNKLSEEMVRTVASLHQRSTDSLSSVLTRTASQEFTASKRRLGRRSSQDISALEFTLDKKGEDGTLDPYGMREDYASWDIGVYASCLEVTVLPTEDNLKEFTALYKRLRGLLEVLKLVEPKEMTHQQRLPFWINIYNALLLHACLVYGVPKSHYKRINLMNKASYIVGGYQYSPLLIEHSILRASSYRPALMGNVATPLVVPPMFTLQDCKHETCMILMHCIRGDDECCQANLLPIHRFKKNDEHFGSSLDQAEPLVSFALCCGSRSSPMLRVYTVANIHAELEAACRDYLMAAVGVSKKKKVLLPKILHWYAKDFSHDAESLMEWIAAKLPPEKRSAFEECLKKKPGKGSRHRMSVRPYDWSFRYLYDQKVF